MSKIQELANQLEKEYAVLLAEVQAEKENIAKDRKTLNNKKAFLDDREESLKKREEEVLKRETEVEAKFSKVRRDEDVEAQYNEVLKIQEKNDKAKKDINDLIAEKDFRIEEIHKMEAALNEEKKTYKAKIEQEFQETIKKLVK